MKLKKRGRPNKVKTSKFYDDIINLLTKQKTPEYISEYLDDKGESIHPDTIRRFRDKEFNIKEEGVKKSHQREIKRKKKLEEAGEDYADINDELRNLINEIFLELNLNSLTPLQKAQLLPPLLRELRERETTDSNLIINIESEIGQENLFEYSSEEMEMIRNWGNQQDEEFIEKL